jgi:dTDP-4-amino-4,6-dideoxygalactose transaminase
LSNFNAAVALSLLQTLDANIAARRARVRAYQHLLGSDNRLELIAHQPGSACLSQIIHILPGHRRSDLAAHLVEALRSAGYEVQGSYVPIHLVDCYQTWARQRLPYAERVWSDLIELPCEPEVSLAEIERIAGIVRRILRSAVFLKRIPVNSPKDKSALRPEAGL